MESNKLYEQSMLDMRSELKEVVKELKKLNKDKGADAGKSESDSEIDPEAIKRCPYSGQIIAAQEKKRIDKEIKKETDKEEETKKQEQVLAAQKTEEENPPLTPEQELQLEIYCTKFTEGFSPPGDKQQSINQLKLVFNMISNANNGNISDNFKTIQMTNDKFRRIKQSNEYFVDFLLNIGFTKTDGKCPQNNDGKFRFIKAVPGQPEEVAKLAEAAGVQNSEL